MFGLLNSLRVGNVLSLTVSGYASSISNTTSFEKSVLSEVLCHDLSKTADASIFSETARLEHIHCRREPFLSLSLEGSVGNVSPVFCFRFRSVFGRFGLGFRWCLAFSHPLPPVFRFRFRSVFGRFGLGFRWCLAFSHPLPTRVIFVFGPD